MRKIFTLLILAILATATVWADEETITLKDGSFANDVITWGGTSCTITQEKGKTGSAPNSSYVAAPRWYDSNVVTFAAKEGYKLTGATVTCTSASYATALQKSSFTGATATVASSVVTITCEANSGFTVTMGAQARISSVKVTYEVADNKTATTLSFGADLDGKTITKYVGETDIDFTHTATLSPAVEGATITYTSSNDEVATVDNGYVLVGTGAEGTATIKAAYAGNDTYKASEASYNIEVKKLPVNFSIASGTTVKKGTVVTVSSVEGATLLYQVNGGDLVKTETNTADITINENSKIEVLASYNGASSDNATATYTVGKVVESIAITGTPATTEYWVGDAFKTDGLTVTATYDDASTEDVTAKSTLAASPATLTEAGEQTVTVTATYSDLTATATYTATVKALPTFTYTWYVDGKVSKTSTLTQGAEVVAPADPANIGDKAFTGWVTTTTVDATTAPDYATIDKTATANTTYYAVFASKDEKWVKKSASEITEEGVYALITAEGKAFNGTITSGHGQSTGATFAFDEKGEATSAPEGTCELTFVKNGAGYKMLNKEANQYLYAKAAKSENLAWKATESSYWNYTSSNWTYNSNNAYLRVNSSSFRTYGYNNGDDLYFAQKFTTYSAYTTLVPAAMASVVVAGEVGNTYNVNDGVVVAKYEAGDKHYLVVKDNAEAVRNSSAPADGDKFFNIAGQKQQEYAQNNWMLVSVPVEQYNQVNANTTLTAVTGTLTDALNTTIEATSVTAGDATEAYTLNAYCPTNFMGNSHVTGKDGNTYYFATPKANEYVKVVWAVYNATDGAFYLPAHSGSINTQEFTGAFKVDYSMNSAEAPELVDGSMYEFEAVVKEVAASDAQSAPRKVDANTNVEPSSKFVVCPVNLTGDKVVTGVSEVNGTKAVKSVSYFNMMGVQAAEPFGGVNIVVTTYTDGTSTAAKVIR